MSLSSVNLDRLTDPEKQKVYEEIADSLSRLSSKFSEYIHKRWVQILVSSSGVVLISKHAFHIIGFALR